MSGEKSIRATLEKFTHENCLIGLTDKAIAGRWQQLEEAGIDFLKYVHNDGVRHPRPNHLAMDGIILPRTDPFWQINYPPNGWGCKCRALAATRAEYEAARLELRTRPENWQELPDKGWDYNVGTAGKQHLIDAMAEKMQRMPQDIARVWMRLIEGMGLEDWGLKKSR